MLRRYLAALAATAALALVLTTHGDVSASTLRSTVTLTVKAELADTVGLATTSAPSIVQRTLALTNGVAISQADTAWSVRVASLAASTATDYDLAGGGLTDAFGAAFAPAKVKVIAVVADGGNTNDVVVGGDANSVPFLSAPTTTHAVAPGGVFLIANPSLAAIAVTAGTGDILQIANGAGGSTVAFDVLVIGTSS